VSTQCCCAMALMKLHDYAGCVVECSKALTINPTCVKALEQRGKAHLKLFQGSQAIQDFELCLLIHDRGDDDGYGSSMSAGDGGERDDDDDDDASSTASSSIPTNPKISGVYEDEDDT